MKKVVEFLQANPVQYLATVGRDERQNAVRSCSTARWMESSVLHQQY